MTRPQLDFRMPSHEERQRIIHEAYELRQQTIRAAIRRLAFWRKRSAA